MVEERRDLLQLLLPNSRQFQRLRGLSCKLGALLSGARPEQAEALERYGNRLGEASQIIDDSLDLVGDP